MSDPNLSHSIFGGDEAPPKTVETVRRRKRHRGPVGCLAVLLALAVVVGAAFMSVDQLRPMVSSIMGGPADYSSSDVSSKKASVTIASGQGAQAIGTMLEKAGVVKSAEAFVDAAKANDKWSAMQPGTYEIAEHSPAKDVVAFLVDPKNKTTKLVTVREGLRKWEVYEALSQATGHPVADYEAAEKKASSLGLPAAANGDVEGWLYPSSYEFSSKTSAEDQLKAMFAKATEVTTRLGISAEKLQDTVIVASIVEAEGKRPEDLSKIARVVDNRLADGMRLQLDSTVVYPVKKRVLATTDADRALVNGYNTYTHEGLPKGPISNPGEKALAAAANPAEGSWLYFVAVNPSTGETKFATTWADHEKNVAEWQQFCQANPGSC